MEVEEGEIEAEFCSWFDGELDKVADEFNKPGDEFNDEINTLAEELEEEEFKMFEESMFLVNEMFVVDPK